MQSGALKRERYRLDEVIGSGGMGVVQRAFDNYNKQYVAIKRLLFDEKASDEKRRETRVLFEREYHTLAQLTHPSIIKVYDYGIDAGGGYYTMELLEGESLRDRAPLHWQQACALMRDVASSLAIIHSRRLVHRDITPNNIYCTADRRAKLIDFGAMTPMGVAEHLAGTAPFMPPEAIQRQPLDGRTDLFSLGASLYYVLTDRHAYPARDIKQLRDLWRTRPTAPSKYYPDIPEALDQLVLALISLSPTGRPSTAAEVFERLTAIAELPTEEQINVAHAYLNSPSLVGRDAALTSVRRRLIKASRKRGGVLLVESDAGVGGSRFLDASVLEAKLLGFIVAKADANSASIAPFGVARLIVRELLAIDPNVGDFIERLGLLPLVRDDPDFIRDAKQDQRDIVIENLNRLLIEISRTKALHIVIDDLDQVDEPSLALLATLSTRIGRKRILITTSIENGARPIAPSAVELLSSSAKRLTLKPLREVDCHAMLSSIFGEVPNLDVLNVFAYRNCSGKPRELMDLANALVEQQLVRYENGNWLISDNYPALEQAMGRGVDIRNRLDALSQDALELISLVALDRDQLMDLDDCVELSEHADKTRIHKALDELVQTGLLQSIGVHVRFSHRVYQQQITTTLSEARRRALHLRLAERSAVKQVNPIYEVYHLLLGGEATQAKEPMRRFSAFADRHPSADILKNPIIFEAVESFVQHAEQQGWAPADYITPLAGLLINYVYRGMPERVKPLADKALRLLSRFSGLTDYEEQKDLDESQRLHTALQLAQQRCEEASSDTDAIDPVSAIKRLSQTSLFTASAALSMVDASMLDIVPSLSPLTPLSPVIGLVERLVSALGKLVKGQNWEAWDDFEAVHKDLVELDTSQTEEMTRAILTGLAAGYLCSLKAEYGATNFTEYIEQFTQKTPTLGRAFRARHLFATGDISAAEAAYRRFEVLSVQTGEPRESRNNELRTLLKIYILADDLMRLKRTIKKMQPLVKTRPGWQFQLALAKAHYLRCCGRIAPALALIEESLSNVPQNHADWAPLAATHITLLSLAGNHREALKRGSDYLERAKHMRVPTVFITLALAQCACESDDFTAAQQYYESALSALEQRGMGGVYLGYCYEVGARIAMYKGDGQTFHRHANQCAELYRVDINPVLTAKFDALLREAEKRDVNLAAGLVKGAKSAGVEASENILSERIRQMTNSIEDPEQRFRVILDLLVEELDASGGVLYLNKTNGLERACVTEGMETPETLDDEIENYYAAETDSSSVFVTATAFDDAQLKEGETLMTTPGDRLLPFLLEYPNDQGVNACGVVVLAVSPEKDVLNNYDTVSTVARYLSEQQLVASSLLV